MGGLSSVRKDDGKSGRQGAGDEFSADKVTASFDLKSASDLARNQPD